MPLTRRIKFTTIMYICHYRTSPTPRSLCPSHSTSLSPLGLNGSICTQSRLALPSSLLDRTPTSVGSSPCDTWLNPFRESEELNGCDVECWLGLLFRFRREPEMLSRLEASDFMKRVRKRWMRGWRMGRQPAMMPTSISRVLSPLAEPRVLEMGDLQPDNVVDFGTRSV